MKKNIATILIVPLTFFVFAACSPDQTTTTPDTTSGASISESTGKWVQKELDQLAQQISDDSIPNAVKKNWTNLTSTIKTDMKNKQISDQLKTGLKELQTVLETETSHSTNPTVKAQLGEIKTGIDAILSKIDY